VSFRPNGIITLLTDFGTSDTYVAQMKGAMLGIDPTLRFVDLTHDVAPQDVSQGAFLLEQSFHSFPGGTVHLAVVDPGVGSVRAPLAVVSGLHAFIGPDNGLLSCAFATIREPTTAVRIEAVPAQHGGRSSTFHGRDVFAPAAALVASGRMRPEALGPAFVPLHSTPRNHGAGGGLVRHVDHFGNLITNLVPEPSILALEVAGNRVDLRVDHYAEVAPGSLVFLVGSSGHLEVSLTGGSAAELLGVSAGAEVLLHRT
jgi:S-adenosyl-L-methionine hydrolase (adenosine-forming)